MRHPYYINSKSKIMKNSILKPIVAGVILGAALFFIPFFVLRVAAAVLIAGALFRLFAERRFRRYRPGIYPAFADKIRNMSDDEYARFKERFQSRCQRADHLNMAGEK